MAKRLGIGFHAPADAKLAATGADGWGSFTLGVVDTTPLELAEAYATVASGGTYCAPLPVSAVTDGQGHRVAVGPQCHRALDPDIANAASDAARCPVGQQSAYHRCDGGTARQVAAMFRGGRWPARPAARRTTPPRIRGIHAHAGRGRHGRRSGRPRRPRGQRRLKPGVSTRWPGTLRHAVGGSLLSGLPTPDPRARLR
jgi:hypothetical protein